MWFSYNSSLNNSVFVQYFFFFHSLSSFIFIYLSIVVYSFLSHFINKPIQLTNCGLWLFVSISLSILFSVWVRRIVNVSGMLANIWIIINDDDHWSTNELIKWKRKIEIMLIEQIDQTEPNRSMTNIFVCLFVVSSTLMNSNVIANTLKHP